MNELKLVVVIPFFMYDTQQRVGLPRMSIPSGTLTVRQHLLVSRICPVVHCQSYKYVIYVLTYIKGGS